MTGFEHRRIRRLSFTDAAAPSQFTEGRKTRARPTFCAGILLRLLKRQRPLDIIAVNSTSSLRERAIHALRAGSSCPDGRSMPDLSMKTEYHDC
jgi:hypothetical protein